MAIQQGQFVEVRGRPWLVEAVDDTRARSDARCGSPASPTTPRASRSRSCGTPRSAPRSCQDDTWRSVGRGAPDSPEVLAAHLRAIRWRSATAADRDLLQAPFRAGIRLDAYQLLPLRKALRLPRVNLLIADDVGLGKTIEAGLVARELLLRRRIDFIVIAAPPVDDAAVEGRAREQVRPLLRHHRPRAPRRAAPPARLLRQSVDAPARASSSRTAC